jgi:hypothetical protein
LRRAPQRGLGDVDRQVGRRAQRAQQQPRLEALAAAVLDQLDVLAPPREARDRVDVGARQRELGAGQVILRQPADALEQLAAGGVVEILRRQRLLRPRQSGNNIFKKQGQTPFFSFAIAKNGVCPYF